MFLPMQAAAPLCHQCLRKFPLVLLRVTLAGEGRQRVLRRMLAACGYGVARLLRVGVGGVALGALRAGHCRELTAEEVEGLR